MPLAADQVLPVVPYDLTLPYDTVVVVDPQITTTVTDGWQAAQMYASNAYDTAVSLLTNLSNTSLFTVGAIDPHLAALDLNIAAFNSLLGTVPNVPVNTFAFTEIPYSSTLLTDLRTQLLKWVDGVSTGIAPAVEQAIWDRGRAREVVTSNRKAREAIRSFAMRGFSKPPGALSLEVQDAIQEAQNNTVALSRDVMIKQADLEQTNRRFSMELAEKMEEAMIAYTNQQMQRALEKAKLLQQFIIDIYQQEVAAYGVIIQAYGARVGAETAAFKAKTDMQVAEANIRLESAKTQLQALIQGVTLRVEVAKAGAQIAAQLAAAALSATSMSGSLQSSVSNSTQNSSSRGVQQSASIQWSTDAHYTPPS